MHKLNQYCKSNAATILLTYAKLFSSLCLHRCRAMLAMKYYFSTFSTAFRRFSIFLLLFSILELLFSCRVFAVVGFIFAYFAACSEELLIDFVMRIANMPVHISLCGVLRRKICDVAEVAEGRHGKEYWYSFILILESFVLHKNIFL